MDRLDDRPRERQQLLREAALAVGKLLRLYKCGHPQWYAELLAACALEGLVQPTNHPNYDVLSATHGRVQVKERVDGTDTTQNRSNFGRYKSDDFDWAAIVLFSIDFTIKGAVLIKCDDVLPLVRAAGHVKWQDVISHRNAIDFTTKFQQFAFE